METKYTLGSPSFKHRHSLHLLCISTHNTQHPISLKVRKNTHKAPPFGNIFFLPLTPSLFHLRLVNFKHDFSRCWGCNIEDWVWDSFSCSSRAELRVKVCLGCTVTGWSSSRFRVFTRLGLGPMLHWCQWHRDVLPSAQLQLFTILHLLLLLFSPLPTHCHCSLTLHILINFSVGVCEQEEHFQLDFQFYSHLKFNLQKEQEGKGKWNILLGHAWEYFLQVWI